MTEIVFYVLAGFAVLSAMLTIMQRNPVPAALWLVSTMFALAGIYVLLHAQFIAAIQVLVYAGAVMVLFLFVIMLLNLGRERSDIRGRPAVAVAAAISLGIVSALLGLRKTSAGTMALALPEAMGKGSPLEVMPGGRAVQSSEAFGNAVGAVAKPLFETYLVPFEITSVLLLAAAVGAVVLAKRKL